MSNDAFDANLPVRLVTEDWPAVTGRPGLTQGRYGEAGNLELVGCAHDDGLWVGWFNADTEEMRAGAAVGHWSGALRFGRGQRYQSATITQVSAGPDFLEVLALTCDGVLRRHVWSPADGFVDRGPLDSRVRSSSGVLETPDGTFVVALLIGDGIHVRTAVPDAAYPSLDFPEVPALRPPGAASPCGVDAAWHGTHMDLLTVDAGQRAWLRCDAMTSDRWLPVADDVREARVAAGPHETVTVLCTGKGRAVIAALGTGGPRRVDLGTAETATVAAVRIGGTSRWHAITQLNGRMTHHIWDPEAGLSSRPVQAHAWVPEGTATTHRGP